MKIIRLQEFRQILLLNQSKYGLESSLLGLDVGTKRIGVAKYDLLSSFVQPIGFIDRTVQENGFIAAQKLSIRLQLLINQHNVVGVVVGFPLQMDGSITPLSKRILHLCEKLDCKMPIENESLHVFDMVCTFWDERESTMGARRKISLMSNRLSSVKKHKDSFAAAIIVESFAEHFLVGRR